jgi:hypothetical protein
MDPLGLEAPRAGVIRPATALQSDLSAVLREGRVLAGEVLQSMGGGSVLVGIGRHRVPAQSQVALEQGQRFFFVVEGQGEELALRILHEREGEPQLLRALRGVLGADQPLGRIAETLLQALQADPTAADLRERFAALLTKLAGSPQQLAAALTSGGPLVYEAKLALAAALHLPASEAAALGADLERWLAAGLQPDAQRETGRVDLLSQLRSALAELLGVGPSRAGRERALAAWIAGSETPSSKSAPDLALLLELAIARLAAGSDRAALLARLRSLNVSQLGRGLELLLLRSLLGVEHVAARSLSREIAARAGSELKASWVEALSRLDPGPAREAVARALEGLEAEQLLNVARRRAGEALHWSVPLLDGERWTTAHLFVQRGCRPDKEADPASAAATWRLSLSLDLSATGPLRADLAARSGALDVWVRAARPGTVSTLQAGMRELESRLAWGGRKVAVHVALAPPQVPPAEDCAADVRFLREHPLMDLSA